MGIFRQASRPSKFKLGIHSNTGGGKTYTASVIMAALHKYCKAKKPIAFFDSEGGSDFVSETIFKPAKIELVVCKSKKFEDLCESLKEAEREMFALIIDTVTAPWDKFTEQFKRDTNQKTIPLMAWGWLKDKWRADFTEPFLNADLHIAALGRSGAIYEQEEEINEQGRAKKVMHKVGTKMRTEGEFGYEPNVLCEMEKVFIDGGGDYIRRCHVIKDRFGVIDSKDFDNPTFENFLPHIKLLDLAGVQDPVDVSPKQIFDAEGNDERAQRAKRRAILCDEIAQTLLSFIPGMGAREKKAKVDIVFSLFGVRGWAAVEQDWKAVPLEKIEEVMKRKDLSEPTELELACIKAVELLSSNAKPAEAVVNG